MGLLGGLIGKLIGIAIILILLVVVVGGFAYATDYKLEATVIDKDCSPSVLEVNVKTKVGGIKHAVKVTQDKCGIIEESNFVEYYLRSERTTIYHNEGGTCIYDTKSGPGCFA
jgi:hypothetical protein